MLNHLFVIIIIIRYLKPFSNVRIIYHIYPAPPLGQDMTPGLFVKRSLTGLNSEFSFS